jgi:hypothetical protein
MIWYHWMTLAAFVICMVSCLYHFFRLIRLGKPTDYSKQSGNIPKAVAYAFTKAMSPAKKESAYLHMPTYTAGILYHLGTFLSIFLFFLIILDFSLGLPTIYIISAFLAVSGIAGVGILIKRMVKKELMALSNLDDFISNILVTLFQFATAFVLLMEAGFIPFYIITTALLLYLPLGKLKHTIYFFAARYHLGFFFGWRNVWPLANSKN